MGLAEAALETYKILWPVLLMILSMVIGAIGYLIKDIRQQLKERQDRQDRDIEKIRDDLSHFKLSLPHTYVMRDDFLRAIASLDMKVDTMARDLGELNKNVTKLLGGGEHRE